MHISFDKKIVLVTGAGSGLGSALVNAFAAAGASVVGLDVNEAALDERRASFDDERRFLPIVCDVSSEDDVRRAIGETLEVHGRLDIACNNAGIAQPIQRLAEVDTAVFDRVFAVNVRGIFLGLKYQLPVMQEQGGGVIVNTASIGGLRGFPYLSIYNATKAAVISLTQTAAVEYGRKNIRINALCPGAFDSAMLGENFTPEQMEYTIKDYPIKRIASADEMANAALWLCSAQNSFMTGQTMVIDGGKTAFS